MTKMLFEPPKIKIDRKELFSFLFIMIYFVMSIER